MSKQQEINTRDRQAII